MNLEDYFTSLAILGGEKTIVLCDRGVMDLQFFGPDENWQYILAEHDWNIINLRDRRYDAIIHLVTSADQAVEYYKTCHPGLTEEVKHFILIFRFHGINKINKITKLRKWRDQSKKQNQLMKN